MIGTDAMPFGTRVRYQDRIWTVVGLDPTFNEAVQIVAVDNGAQKCVMPDLLEEVGYEQ